MEQLPMHLLDRRAIAAILGLWIASVYCLSFAVADEKTAEDLSTARQQAYATYSAQLQALAEKCATHGLPTQADFTRNWLPKRDPAILYIFALPENSAAPKSLV